MIMKTETDAAANENPMFTPRKSTNATADTTALNTDVRAWGAVIPKLINDAINTHMLPTIKPAAEVSDLPQT